MRVFENMDELPEFRRAVVTIGSFDGVHRGHRHLLGILRSRAATIDGETVVVTFAEHPRHVLEAKGELRLLTTLEQKQLLIAAEGIDNLVVMPFDEAVSRLSPEQFVRDFVVGKLGARELVVGYNHRFGRDRAGDAQVLRGLEAECGFRIIEAPQFAPDGEKISSTTIREALFRGDVAIAERLLGRKL